MRNAFAFVLGFTVVFVLLGLFAGFFGMILGPYRSVISQIAGFIFILFGLTMFGVRIPFLSVERHVAVSSFSVGKFWSSFGIGALFALGWSPCIGPILGTVLLLASQSTTIVQGALLLLVFALGLGIPFLVTAYFIDKIGGLFARLSSITHYFTYLGAATLILFGVLMLFNQMGALVEWGLSFFDNFYQMILPYM